MARLVASVLMLALVLVLASCASSSAERSVLDAASPASASAVAESGSGSSAAVASSEPAASFALESVPAYNGKPSVRLNGGMPYFTGADLARPPFEEYAELDALGRCGPAFALVGPETMPSEPRGSIGMIRPSGWHTVRYDWVDGGYLFNRCHLIGYQLAGENDNVRNLITGTRSMNVSGMLPYEDEVAAYVQRTGGHVLYRATPVFEADELVARGVLLEAQSIDDGGAGVRFCAWCYNVEPGVEIDYLTGESRAVAQGGDSGTASGSASQDAVAPAQDDSATPPASDSATSASDVRTYVLNTRSRKIHLPDCSSIDDMADHNKSVVEATREELIEQGYTPCGRCNP